MQGKEEIYFNVLIESPIIELPRRQGSCDVLVGHLGNITIKNGYDSIGDSIIHQVMAIYYMY